MMGEGRREGVGEGGREGVGEGGAGKGRVYSLNVSFIVLFCYSFRLYELHWCWHVA